MNVKICGIQSFEAASWAREAGADMIGFVFAESSRKIPSEFARQLAEAVGSDVKKVGVFVNESEETIRSIVEEVGLDYVQLHGDETAEFARRMPVPVIKAFSAKDDLSFEEMFAFPADYILVDSPPAAFRGGSGRTFDWSILENPGVDKSRLILAGGLHPDNIEEAVQSVGPFAVDISSGVETDGRKDETKIFQFVERAKGAHQS
ncbi:phosphoribosylanthranilate isomerase [Domibacillus sp. DTU_2020_1001157_1_SI_ALB_TIR_016]|uniref:phosphoribosylanthranilate isomerase n=1 Tax=Domibacillus sp. DTU_2020_1001157_1_SI_ALB_TIR_016 TaxID=3077789 RepID=UPI0028ECA9DA|nr:phosphoribosylanthranilate isomerase [Domibacillus sp. DTU_2020_1001157_1_SI_ALB_TIR_016]WNS82314.1 phosphoribosylanthranilate isomerase [Domibacillus sp. DTU_2020_1001157_1_SI_ALB_TIR_016]